MKELDKPSIIVMDNAPVHRKNIIKEILEKHGHILLPLPKYSPDFNPIEQSFGAMKKRRESMPIETTVDELFLSYS
jgi:transposase